MSAVSWKKYARSNTSHTPPYALVISRAQTLQSRPVPSTSSRRAIARCRVLLGAVRTSFRASPVYELFIESRRIGGGDCGNCGPADISSGAGRRRKLCAHRASRGVSGLCRKLSSNGLRASYKLRRPADNCTTRRSARVAARQMRRCLRRKRSMRSASKRKASSLYSGSRQSGDAPRARFARAARGRFASLSGVAARRRRRLSISRRAAETRRRSC